jgi:hypothetical protein
MNRFERRREKLFGDGRPRPMSRELKNRLMRLARVLTRPTEPGKHYGRITAKQLRVFEALLWGFHNARTGLCFPSYEAIAEAAGCARSTVAEAIQALEAAGLLSWVHRLKRVSVRIAGRIGWHVKVVRTSNGYQLADPPDVSASESEIKPGTEGQDSTSSAAKAAPIILDPENPLHAALMRLDKARKTTPPASACQ